MSGGLEFAYLALVQCIRDPPKFFAERIRRAIDGMGTNDTDLIRAIVSRCVPLFVCGCASLWNCLVC